MMHLRVMESLGGDTRWSDRFFARHAAIIYYWVLVVVRYGSWEGFSPKKTIVMACWKVRIDTMFMWDASSQRSFLHLTGGFLPSGVHDLSLPGLQLQ